MFTIALCRRYFREMLPFLPKRIHRLWAAKLRWRGCGRYAATAPSAPPLRGPWQHAGWLPALRRLGAVESSRVAAESSLPSFFQRPLYTRKRTHHDMDGGDIPTPPTYQFDPTFVTSQGLEKWCTHCHEQLGWAAMARMRGCASKVAAYEESLTNLWNAVIKRQAWEETAVEQIACQCG